MSGFIALFNRSGQAVNAALLDQLTQKLTRRGPDGHGTWCGGPVGLGRSLLQSTCEIEHVAGPIALDGIHLAGDVRLDDRDELFRRLRAAGDAIPSQAPDAELLIHAWRLWGAACLDLVAGDFAFVVWDSRQHRLFAARDHFGVVPLFYAEAGDALLISNSLPCILACPGVDSTLSEEAVADHLAVGSNTRRDTTYFNGVKRLVPGCLLNASKDDVRISSYWTPSEFGPALRYRHARDYVRHFQEIFDAAVRDRVRSNRVAADLSGGMDSSSIAVTIARQYGSASIECLRTYTCYFRDLIDDKEGELGRAIATYSGISHECFAIEPLWGQSEDRTRLHVPPEPGSNAILSPRTIMNRLAADHGRVIFTGSGGDPLFGSMAVPSLTSVTPVSAAYFLRDLAYCYQAHGQAPRLGLRRLWSRPKPIPVVPDQFLNPEFASRFDLHGRRQGWLASRHRLGRYSMATNVMWPQTFEKTDADFTGLALKARFPFFDLRLFHYLNRLPEFPWARDKLLLRLAMRESLPEQVRSRPKTALRENPYLRHWQRNGPQRWMFDLIQSDELQPYIDRNSTLAMLRHPEDWNWSTVSRFSTLCHFAIWLQRQSPRATMNHAVVKC